MRDEYYGNEKRNDEGRPKALSRNMKGSALANREEIHPFISAEEAWFWFMDCYQAREDGAKFTAGKGLYKRPCEPIDILNVVSRLHRNRRLLMDHIYVLKHYGQRHMPPDRHRKNEQRARTLWEEALERIEDVLERKGVVQRPYNPPALDWYEKALVYENTIFGGRA